MATRRTIAVMLGIPLLAGGCWGMTHEEPPIHFQQNMDHQERGEAQERNDFFADGRAMRLPPKGTVAVGHLAESDHLYRGVGTDGMLATTLPEGILLSEALLDRGRDRYAIYCAPCHGLAGYGDGPATRRGGGMSVMPAHLHLPRLQEEPLGHLYRVMTYGQGQMKSYAAQVPVADRWAIAAWVRVLQVSHLAKETDLPASAQAAATRSTP